MSTVLKSSLEPLINNYFDSNSNVVKFDKYIKKYFDKNQETLYAIGPLYRLYFGDAERDFIFDEIRLKQNYVKELVKKIDDINAAWRVVADPFNLTMTNYIRCAAIKKEEKVLHSSIMYLTLSLYSSLHYKYYRYLPNVNAMTYAINGMNQKFLIKKYGVLFKALEHIALKNHETYEANLLRGEDLDIKDYIMNLRTRLNNFMKIITDEYLKAVKEKKYLNTEEDNNDEENYKQTTNISLEIESLVMKSSNRFFASELNMRFVNAVAKYCNCHNVTLQNALENIKEKEKETVIDLMRYILQIYLSNQSNSFESIKTNRFVPYCIQVYSKSNIKDQNVLDMKKLLDYFLKEHCDRYSGTEREATRSAYRKAVYLYFAFLLNNTAVR